MNMYQRGLLKIFNVILICANNAILCDTYISHENLPLPDLVTICKRFAQLWVNLQMVGGVGEINNPQNMYIDATSFMMLSQYLPMLLGSIIRPGNRKVKIRDFEGFEDWLHVILDPVVMRIFAGETNVERELTKDIILEALKTSFGSL
jgi:hypothetical protein